MIDENVQQDVADITDIDGEEDVMKNFNFDNILDSTGNNSDELSVGGEQQIEEGQVMEPTMSEEDIFMDPKNDIAIDENGEEYVSETNNVTSSESVLTDGVAEDNVLVDEGSVESDDTNITQVSDSEKFDDSYENVNSLSPLSGLEETINLPYLKIYDGGSTDNMYKIERNFNEGAFEGTSECNTIHINVGYDTYGWNVEFANGVTMGLRDVKEYQKRQGGLPFNSGSITYGGKVLRFANVARIVVYESVKYFSYGA